MTPDVLAVGPEDRARRQSAIGVLGRKEAWRLLTSPAIPLLLGYLVLVMGVDALGGGDDSKPLFNRDALSELLSYVSLLFLGPLTFVATHLLATSSRRSGSERLLVATPVDRRRRDLALCLGVLAGPAMAALAVAGLSALLADGVMTTSGGTVTANAWSWTDFAQVPAIVLGAGVLGVVVARWLPYPGSLLLSLVVMVLGTGWMVAADGVTAIRPWLAPYVAISWWTDQPWISEGSYAWHLAYLLSLSGIGVCAVGLRRSERRGRWLGAATFALAAVVATGLLQLA